MRTILIEQPGKIRISETAMPKPKEGEALLKIRYCGICGSDVASISAISPLPPILESRGMNSVRRLFRFLRIRWD